MMKIEKVLLTGAAGYIGSVLARRLLKRGFKVWGLDNLIFGDRGIKTIRENPEFRFIEADVRKTDSLRPILNEVDAVVHLAALSGMPTCAKYPELAQQINWLATKDLFDASHETPCIKRFLFASSTSIYGAVKDREFVDEQSPANPISLYGELKARCEEYLGRSKLRSGFIPILLRFPTAYGLSPRIRFDLTVNEFTRDLTQGKALEIFGENFWRPYCHVEDLARACIWALEVDSNLVDQEVYCVGDTGENYTKRMIYEALSELIPEGKISLVQKIEDLRDYRVDFSKIKKAGFNVTKTVRDGIREIHQALRQGQIPNPFDPAHTSAL